MTLKNDNVFSNSSMEGGIVLMETIKNEDTTLECQIRNEQEDISIWFPRNLLKLRGERFFLIMMFLFLIIGGCSSDGNETPSLSGGTTPDPPVNETIRILPGATLAVGEEIYVDATLVEGLTSPVTAVYTWDFGDNITLPAVGFCATHTYSRPGTFTISLSIIDNSTTTTYTGTVHVTGHHPKLSPIYSSPLLVAKFDGSLTDISEHGRTITSPSPVYLSGIENDALNTSGTNGHAVITDGSVLNDLSAFTVSFWYKNSAAGITGDTNGYLIHKVNSSNSTEFIIRIRSGYIGAGIMVNGTLRTAQTYLNSYGVNNALWHHVAMVYDGNYIRLYVDGHEVKSGTCPLAVTGTTAISSTNIYIGKQADGTTTFPGDIDEIKIYGKALTRGEIFTGFELWHADFHARYSQFIYAQIPEAYRNHRLTATLTGPGYSNTLFDQTGSLAAEEKFLLNNYQLNAGDYTLTATIRNGSTTIDTATKRFSKTYSGIAAVSIDKNNAYRINGTPIFPITPWGLNSPYIASWNHNYINVLFGLGFWNSWDTLINLKTVTAWGNYLDAAEQNGMRAIGPDIWSEGLPDRPYRRNADVTVIENYVQTHSNHAGLFAWSWEDEPNLGGDSGETPATVVRAWTKLSHRYDPQHPVIINYAGKSYTRTIAGDGDPWAWHVTSGRKHAYLFNKKQFGGPTTIVDGTSLDYYPLDWAAPHSDNATMVRLARAIDTLISENYNLIPVFSFVETTDIYESPYSTRWYPTVDQIKMMAWLNVVHGAKGLGWFTYRSTTPDEHYAALSDFKELIDHFTFVLLSDDTARTVTVDIPLPSNPWSAGASYARGNEVRHNGISYICIQAHSGVEPGVEPITNFSDAAYWKVSRRIDMMIKEDATNIYIFAVRLTEIDNVGVPAALHVGGSPIEEISERRESKVAVSVGPEPLAATFTIGGSMGSNAVVYNENRNVAVSGSTFTDNFNLNNVHIYVIAK